MCPWIIIRQFTLELASLSSSAVDLTSIACGPNWLTCFNLKLNRVCSDKTPPDCLCNWHGFTGMIRTELHAVTIFDKKDKLRNIGLRDGRIYLQYASFLWHTTKFQTVNNPFTLNTPYIMQMRCHKRRLLFFWTEFSFAFNTTFN